MSNKPTDTLTDNYFPGFVQSGMKMLGNSMQLAIAALLNDGKSMSLSQLRDCLGISETVLTGHLQPLITSSIIEHEIKRDGDKRFASQYSMTDFGKTLVGSYLHALMEYMQMDLPEQGQVPGQERAMASLVVPAEQPASIDTFFRTMRPYYAGPGNSNPSTVFYCSHAYHRQDSVPGPTQWDNGHEDGSDEHDMVSRVGNLLAARFPAFFLDSAKGFQNALRMNILMTLFHDKHERSFSELVEIADASRNQTLRHLTLLAAGNLVEARTTHDRVGGDSVLYSLSEFGGILIKNVLSGISSMMLGPNGAS